jgi:hypothetical protein
MNRPQAAPPTQNLRRQLDAGLGDILQVAGFATFSISVRAHTSSRHRSYRQRDGIEAHTVINQAQYSAIVAASAVVPTLIANAFFLPHRLLPERGTAMPESSGV